MITGFITGVAVAVPTALITMKLLNSSLFISNEELKEAKQGEEVAVAIKGPTVGRHIEELEQFYVDIPESHVPRLAKVELTELEKEILEEIIKLHRKDDHFWGRRHIA